jgi:hypothetical protein
MGRVKVNLDSARLGPEVSDKAKRYGPDDPACDIHTLVAHLASERQDGDLYRGQTRHYPALIPSQWRAGIVQETAADPLVRIDSAKLADAQAARRDQLRIWLLHWLINRLGIGVGNLVGQQYGLSSECIDATENIQIAAFFATRSYPEYTLGPAEGVGVIYRFRNMFGGLQPSTLSLRSLADWFERGQHDEGFFDWFVEMKRLESVFDRDRWPDWGRARDEPALVKTLPLAISWREVGFALENAVAEGSYFNAPDARHILDVEWRLARVARQDGGFVLPRTAWLALLPLSYRVTLEPREEHSIMLSASNGDGSTDTIPRIDPSLAIKRHLLGIENILPDPGCDAFFFCHTGARITGLYRRELWPEPSEDPLYEVLWIKSFTRLMGAYGDEMPPIDDPRQGILDRGYRVAGERVTRDARDLDDLARGQLEDAGEAIAAARDPSEMDQLILAGALSSLGREDEALEALEHALSAPDASHASVLSLARLVWTTDPERAAEMVALAAEMAPEDSMVLWARSDLYKDQGAYSEAADLLDRVLDTFDRKLTPEYKLVIGRAELAERLGQAERLEEMLQRFQALGFDRDELEAHIFKTEGAPSAIRPFRR